MYIINCLSYIQYVINSFYSIIFVQAFQFLVIFLSSLIEPNYVMFKIRTAVFLI